MKLFELKRFFVVTLLVCLGVGQSWAGGGNSHSTHYGKITALAAEGQGKVYISETNTAPSDDAFVETQSKTWNCGGNSDSDANPYYLQAKPNLGYIFSNWDGSTDWRGNYTHTETSWKPNDSANNGTETNPKTYTHTANFTKLHRYAASIEVKAVCDGEESGEGGTVEVVGDSQKSYPTTSTSNIYDIHGNTWAEGAGDPYTTSTSQNNRTFTFTVKATPASEDYQFMGWTEDDKDANPTNANQANSHSVTVTCTVNNAVDVHEYTASKKVYAIFKKKHTYYSEANVHSSDASMGTVSVATTNTAGTYASSSTATNSTTNTETSATHTYYRFAKPNDGYMFVGWYDNGACIGEGSIGDSFSFTTSSQDENVPETRTFYAKFVRAEYMLRNRETGRFLMNGGTNSTHAVVGNYAKIQVALSSYSGESKSFSTIITTPYGNLTQDAVLDGVPTTWTFTKNEEGFYTITNNGNALTTAGTYFNDNPLYQYVGTATLNPEDKNQQWEIVTEGMLKAEREMATPSNPVNVSYFITNPNFDKVDGTTGSDNSKAASGWTYDRKDSSLDVVIKNNGIDGNANDPKCNYNWGISTQKSLWNNRNQWECYQNLSGLPAGYYIVTNQGFEQGTQHTRLYATPNSTNSNTGKKYVSLAPYNGEDFSGGNTQANAAVAFNNNKYNNILPVVQVGNNGVLRIGVEKTENDDDSGWMVFDNFQLYYLGEKAPAEGTTYDYDVIGSTRKAEMDNGKLKVTGTWRVLNEQELVDKMSEIEDSDEEKKAENSPLVIDATNATLIAKPTFPTPANPNTIIKVMGENKVANTQNVVYGVEENGEVAYKSTNLVLDEGHPLATNEIVGVNADQIAVNRKFNGKLWNTFCIPFDISVADLQYALEVDAIYANCLKEVTVDKDDSYSLHFGPVEGGNLVGGNSYIVWVPEDVSTDAITISANDKEVKAPNDEAVDDYVIFQGTYSKTTAPVNSYVIIKDEFYTVVENQPVNVKGFRGWFEVVAEGAEGEEGESKNLSATFNDEDVTGISSVHEHTSTERNTGWYNIAGQRVNENAKGIIIKNGKKYLVK